MRRVVIPYKQHLKKYTRQLRSNMTLAEVLLWNELKRKKLLGYDFDRQRSIDEFIVDFFCKDLALAIEVDGSSHNFNEEQDHLAVTAREGLVFRPDRFPALDKPCQLCPDLRIDPHPVLW